MTGKRQMRLGAFIYPTGHHVAGWRHPASYAGGGIEFRHYVAVAKTVERGRFDMLFLADNLAVLPRESETLETASRLAHFGQFEPVTLLSALAAVTSHVGLVATVTTTYNEPYHVARKFASLDLISGGRAGWNLVTSGSLDEAPNFGTADHPKHYDRYARAREFTEVVKGLWRSWDADAFALDKASGRFFDPSKLHLLNHSGPFFNVRGPLNVPGSPQGAPVLVQAGSSESGKMLAAETGEVVFTAHQALPEAFAFAHEIRSRAAKIGRDPEQLCILPGLMPIVAHTENEAHEKFAELQSLIHPDVGLMLVSRMAGYDLTGFDPHSPMPLVPVTEGPMSRAALLNALATAEGLTLREVYTRVAGARGHWQLYGTPNSIVDRMQEWFEAGAADGFNIMPAVLPQSLDEFVEMVIPELQRRGLVRRDYEGFTLRDNLGLAPPPGRCSRFT